jgi:hypothetical protein
MVMAENYHCVHVSFWAGTKLVNSFPEKVHVFFSDFEEKQLDVIKNCGFFL